MVWSQDLPELPTQLLGKIYDMLKSSRYTNHAFLFAVGNPDEEDNLTLEVISNETRYSHEDDNEDGLLKFSSMMISPDALGEQLKEGDVILIRPKRVKNQENPIVITEAEGVVTTLTKEQATDYAMKETKGFRLPAWTVGSKDSLEMEIGHKLSKHDNDEIIVIACDEAGSNDQVNNDVVTGVMSSKGAKLYWCDALVDDLYGTHFEHGIWVGEDIAWYNNGEDGAEWTASFGKATLADLDRHGLSWADIDDFYADATGKNPSFADVAGMLSPSWEQAIVVQKNGNSCVIEEIAYEWIKEIARKYHVDEKCMIISPTTKSGLFMTLVKNGHPLASATITHDSESRTILTRWLRPEEAQELFRAEIAAWKDKK